MELRSQHDIGTAPQRPRHKFSTAAAEPEGSKCKFLKPELDFLGHVIGADGIKIDPKKITTIRDWKAPTNLQELQSFLGFINYVWRVIPNMAGTTGPLTDLLRKGTSFEWGERQ
ncbi:hypothetical protein CLOM_g13599 [Closterium sp. NIES-68]|nr:hypothetical protein CLOM_g12631 [Closterium sp. NIES-68]GJP54519.1 hypothetical protein CLOM_g13599 [Closterium sp. NIES-68]